MAARASSTWGGGGGGFFCSAASASSASSPSSSSCSRRASAAFRFARRYSFVSPASESFRDLSFAGALVLRSSSSPSVDEPEASAGAALSPQQREQLTSRAAKAGSATALEAELLIAMVARRPELRPILEMSSADDVRKALLPYRRDVAAVLQEVAARAAASPPP